MNRKISKQGLHFIKEHEGVELNVYKDVAGLPTIGIGHLLTQDELRSGKIDIMGAKVRYGNGISLEDAYGLLDQDLDRFEAAVNKYVTVPLTQNKFDALVSLAFNIGVGAFSSSTLLKFLNKGNYKEACNQFSRWVYSGGKVIQGLINRRQDEQQLWIKGYDGEVQSKKELPTGQIVITGAEGSTFEYTMDKDGTHNLKLQGSWYIK